MIAGHRAVRRLPHQGYEKWEICQDAKGNTAFKCVSASIISSPEQSRADFMFVQYENEQTLLSLHSWHKYCMIINVDISREEYAEKKQSCSAPDMPVRFPQIA